MMTKMVKLMMRMQMVLMKTMVMALFVTMKTMITEMLMTMMMLLGASKCCDGVDENGDDEDEVRTYSDSRALQRQSRCSADELDGSV